MYTCIYFDFMSAVCNRPSLLYFTAIITGTPASSLAQYSVTMQSTTAFRATINTTDSTVFGEWQIVFQGSGSYIIFVSALSDLRFSSELLVFDPSSGYRFRKVVGKPQRGTLT